MDQRTSGQLPDIRKSLLLKAPVGKVWEAVATSEGIAAWFMPNTFKPELGYDFQLNAGPYGMSPCKVTELNPPNRLSFAWGEAWTLTFELKEREGGTEFTLIHGGWSEEKATEFGEPHSVVRDRMDQGWSGLTEKLRAHVEG
ncbi:SRPBCC domain-containing protein [Paenibacillus thermoaerophilus]|uniref:SRPBCC domain-containing protein n=1 Tax=Paenibacillus thermoaerophilus TaxID=1215385 RepID=A0ABW2UZP7_9BACL|nr:SRPBCC domain-containing protein [Paenibacillus thermoaerophilus]TMV14310.1 SRPBCC domain-containing protein [Paenibacillus thermoaerophilus]